MKVVLVTAQSYSALKQEDQLDCAVSNTGLEVAAAQPRSKGTYVPLRVMLSHCNGATWICTSEIGLLRSAPVLQRQADLSGRGQSHPMPGPNPPSPLPILVPSTGASLPPWASAKARFSLCGLPHPHASLVDSREGAGVLYGMTATHLGQHKICASLQALWIVLSENLLLAALSSHESDLKILICDLNAYKQQH